MCILHYLINYKQLVSNTQVGTVLAWTNQSRSVRLLGTPWPTSGNLCPTSGEMVFVLYKNYLKLCSKK